MEPDYLIQADAAGVAVLDAIKRGTCSIFWGDNQGNVFNNGSMFFLDTGVTLLAVTARHVYESYLERRRDIPGPELVCQIDGMHFDPVSRLIAAGTDIDITTFHITAEELRCLRRITTRWPPVIPEVGNGVLVCGLPGETRLTPRPGLLDIGYSTALMRVDSVTDRTISMMMQPNEEMIDILGIGLPPPSRDIGGMSGGPVAAVVTSTSGIFSWAISGVIYEGHQSFDIIQAMRADLIRPDGSLIE